MMEVATKLRRRRGFTLVEVLATLVLIAIVLPTVMQGVSMATAVADSAKRRTEASGLAQSKLNELIVTGQWQQGIAAGDFGADWPGYRWQLNRQNWAYDTTTVGLQQLDMTVSWTARGKQQQVVLSTLTYARTTQ